MMRPILLTLAMLAVPALAAPDPAAAPAPTTVIAGAPVPGQVAVAVPFVTRVVKYKSDVICTSRVETGSLIKSHKMCLTKKQRDYLNDENEREARRLVHDNQGLQVGPGN